MATDIRKNLERLMRGTVADEAVNHTWTYEAVRPMPVPAHWAPKQHVTGDCSKGVQYLCHWADGPDPMGMGYGPYGNSQTLWLKLQHLDSPSDLYIGDIVTFGFNGDEHATMVLEKGSDPLLWSFGHQGAPDTYKLSYDHRPSQYLRYPVPYVETPQERLRAMTGWFAWVAWRLGEGDWRHWGPANPTVRPNVPERIPLTWWKRYAQFIANRNKGS